MDLHVDLELVQAGECLATEAARSWGGVHFQLVLLQLLLVHERPLAGGAVESD